MSRLEFSPLHFRSLKEYARFDALKRVSWTTWYAPGPGPRHQVHGDYLKLNALAAVFPEFYREVRGPDGVQLAWVFASPTWWGGDPEALQTLMQHHRLPTNPYLLWATTGAHRVQRAHLPLPFRWLSARERRRRVTSNNTMMLIALHISPEAQGQGLSAQIIDTQRGLARDLNFKHLISPFRPSAYGDFKRDSGRAHGGETFADYCALRRPDGRPQDPWLRALDRSGMRPLRAEARSFVVTRSRAEFEGFRQSFQPKAWYEPSPGTFECGQTPTWYVDEGRDVVMSVEPNLWGEIPL